MTAAFNPHKTYLNFLPDSSVAHQTGLRQRPMKVLVSQEPTVDCRPCEVAPSPVRVYDHKAMLPAGGERVASRPSFRHFHAVSSGCPGHKDWDTIQRFPFKFESISSCFKHQGVWHSAVCLNIHSMSLEGWERTSHSTSSLDGFHSDYLPSVTRWALTSKCIDFNRPAGDQQNLPLGKAVE